MQMCVIWKDVLRNRSSEITPPAVSLKLSSKFLLLYIDCFDARLQIRWWFPVLSRATVLELVYLSYLWHVIKAIVFFVWFNSYISVR